MPEQGTNTSYGPGKAPEAVASAITSVFANPQTPSGFLNRDPNELAFLFNEESGELEIANKQQPPAQVQETPAQLSQTGEPPKEVDQEQSPDARFNRLEQAVATIGMLIKGMQDGIQMQQPQQQQQTPREEVIDYSGLDMSDANTVVGLIKHTVASVLKSELAPIIQKQNELGVKSSYLEAGQVHGDDFKAAIPVLETLAKAGILKSDPNMDFKSVVSTLKQAGLLPNTAKSDSTIQSNNGSTPNGNGKPQLAKELVERANAMATESPSIQRNLVNNNDQPVKTVEDAFNKAWNTEVLGNR